MQQPDDLTLVKRCRDGDAKAFQTLVERYQKRVYALALGMLKDRDEAMDIAQETFVKVYKYLDHFKGDSSFYTWIYRIATNLAIDARRRKAPAGDPVEFDEAVQRESPDEPGVMSSRLGSNPQQALMRRELVNKIDEALSQLPEKHRSILVLREVEGLSYEDLARTLKIRKGTVMSRLFHARKKVQKILSAYLETAEDLGEES